MVDIQNYGSFILAVLVFQMIPGAGTVSILNATAKKGIGAGMKAVFGTLCGDFIYMLAAVLGLAAVLEAYPGVLSYAQWAGAAYLCWFGLKLIRSATSARSDSDNPGQTGFVYFRQSLAVSLTNPKVVMFFMAFFPLFLSEGASTLTLLVLMAHVTLISLMYQFFLVVAGNAAARRLSGWRFARSTAVRLAGAALIAFGIKLAINNR